MADLNINITGSLGLSSVSRNLPNSPQVGANSESNKEAAANKHKNKEQMEGKEVLGLMETMSLSNQALISKTQATEKVVDVKKYVSNETSIAEFMKNFEENFDNTLDIINKEYGFLPKEAQNNLALAVLDREYNYM